jgi:hypothetical protein
MISILSLGFLLQAGAPAAPSPDSALAVRDARRAQARFERVSRQRAPLTFSSWGGACDEIVGRYCLTYSTESLPAPAPEPGDVSHIRREAIEAFRRAFSHAPGDLDVTGPLVRYLIEDERAGEAVSAARAFRALSDDPVWGALLLGFALHAAGDIVAAEQFLDEGLTALPERERARIEDVEWLLGHDDRRLYRRMDAAERVAYREAFWRVADPLYLTPGNERRTEHVARHVWSRILSRTPVVPDMERWGRDLEQLTVRYGIPSSRMRALGNRPGETSMVERYDPDQLAYSPEDLRSRGLPPAPLPGESWPLDNPRAHSGDAPVTIRRIVPAEHQLSRFPDGADVLLRVDAQVVLDSLAADSDSVRTGFYLLDAAYQPAHGAMRVQPVAGDTVLFTHRWRALPGEYVYSIELFEPGSRFGARARYAATVPAPMRGPRLSDIVVNHAFGDTVPAGRDDPRLRPLGSLIVPPEATLGLYAEVSGLGAARDGSASYRVELTRHTADRNSLPRELVNWLGRRLGLASAPAEPTVAWTARGRPGAAVNTIAVDVALGGAAPGQYVFEIVVADLVTGESSSSRRPVRVR